MTEPLFFEKAAAPFDVCRKHVHGQLDDELSTLGFFGSLLNSIRAIDVERSFKKYLNSALFTTSSDASSFNQPLHTPAATPSHRAQVPSEDRLSLFLSVCVCLAGRQAGRQAPTLMQMHTQTQSRTQTQTQTRTQTQPQTETRTIAIANANARRNPGTFIFHCFFQYFQAAGHVVMNANVQRRLTYKHKPKCKRRRKHNRKQKRKHDHNCRRKRMQERWRVSPPEPTVRIPQMASRETAGFVQLCPGHGIR